MIAVVVPNWNGREHLSECLHSLRNQESGIENLEIIAVDAGSTDGSLELMQKEFPDIEIVRVGFNKGFAGNVNVGIKKAIEQGAELVALFNNDAVANKNWLKYLLKTATLNGKTGIVTCKFLQAQDRKRFDSTGEQYSVWGLPFPRGRDEIDKGQYDSTEEVFGASGGASLYRVKMLEEIGLFDEDFFAYYEDVDLSFRARLAGWKVVYEPKAVAFHKLGATSSKVPNFARFHTVKNFQYLYLKNMPGRLFWKYLPRFFLAYALIFANCLRRGQLLVFLKADAMASVKLPGTLLKRRRIQRTRKVSSRYIDSLLYKKLPPTQKTLLGLRQKLSKR